MEITFPSCFLNTSPLSMVLIRRVWTTNLDGGERCSFCKLVDFWISGPALSLHNEPPVLWDSLHGSESHSMSFSWDLVCCWKWLLPTTQGTSFKSIPISEQVPKFLKMGSQRGFLDGLSCEDPCELILPMSFVHIFCILPYGQGPCGKPRRTTQGFIPQGAHSVVGDMSSYSQRTFMQGSIISLLQNCRRSYSLGEFKGK